MEEEAEAQVKIWEHALGFTPSAVVKCAIELRIPDILEGSHGGAMSLIDLSSALACSPSALHRIMRYLSHRGFFKRIYSNSTTNDQSSISYANTPLSRLLLKDGERSMASFVLLQNSQMMLNPWHRLSSRALLDGASPFKAVNGEDIWKYVSQNPDHAKLFNEGMACRARLNASKILGRCKEVFEGIGCLVDVGGGNGVTLASIVKECPWIRGINFDLPHVVSEAPRHQGVEHVGGNMFERVPKADAAFLMCVLHDWSDDECMQILRKCREAVPKETGKVIIAESIIGEGEGEDDKYVDICLTMDMAMMTYTENGKERTTKEWEGVVRGAGFSSFKVSHITGSHISIIEAFP